MAKRVVPSQPESSAAHVIETAAIMPNTWPNAWPTPRHASARSRNLSGTRSPKAAASGIDTIACPISVNSQNTMTNGMKSHAERIATDVAVSTVPAMIHGVRRPSGQYEWSDPTEIHAFIRNVNNVPTTLSSARSVTRSVPERRLMVCGMSTELSAAIGAVNSSAPSAKPAVRRCPCGLVGVVPSGAVIGSRRSRNDDSRFGTAASRWANAVSGEPPSVLMRVCCTSGRSLEASGTRGFCCTAKRFRAALVSSVSVFS